MNAKNRSSSSAPRPFRITGILSCTLAGLVILSGGFFYLTLRHYPVSLTPALYAETSDPLSNPYQGWYRIYRYELTEEALFSPEQVEESLLYDPFSRLALLEINLKAYRDTPLSSTALAQLDSILLAWSRTDKAMILRFLYDWEGRASETEPDSILRIQEHIRQTAPLINAYAASVYLLQGIFVGDTGEMTRSAYMTPEAMSALMTTLHEEVDSSVFLSVRTPAHYRQITGRRTPLESREAFSGLLPARIGLYNDGMTGSESDYGTYGSDYLHSGSPLSAKGGRDQEIAFQNQLCRFVPNGGEVICDNFYNDPQQALPYLEALHVSYLNYDYDPAVLQKWKDSSFRGTDVYTYIEAHMGYRYFLSHASLETKGYFAETATLDLSVVNRGFSNAYRPFRCSLTLEDMSTGDLLSFPIDTDNRFWNSGETVRLSVPLSLEQLSGSSYRAYLTLEDTSRQELIRFANTEEAPYGCPIGSISVEENSLLAK